MVKAAAAKHREISNIEKTLGERIEGRLEQRGGFQHRGNAYRRASLTSSSVFAVTDDLDDDPPKETPNAGRKVNSTRRGAVGEKGLYDGRGIPKAVDVMAASRLEQRGGGSATSRGVARSSLHKAETNGVARRTSSLPTAEEVMRPRERVLTVEDGLRRRNEASGRRNEALRERREHVQLGIRARNNKWLDSANLIERARAATKDLESYYDPAKEVHDAHRERKGIIALKRRPWERREEEVINLHWLFKDQKFFLQVPPANREDLYRLVQLVPCTPDQLCILQVRLSRSLFLLLSCVCLSQLTSCAPLYSDPSRVTKPTPSA